MLKQFVLISTVAVLFGTSIAADPPATPTEVSPAGTLLIVSQTEDVVHLVDAYTGEQLASLPTERVPHEVTVSPDGRLAAVSNFGKKRTQGHTITMIDVGTGKVRETVDLGDYRHPHSLTWTPDGRIAVVTQGSGHLVLVDPTGHRPLQAIATPWDNADDVAITPNGKLAFVTHLGSDSLAVLDLARGESVREIKTGSGPDGVAVTPDGREVWVATRAANQLTVIDVASLEIVATIPTPGFPIRLAIVPDGSRVLVSCSRSQEIAAFDVSSRKEVGRTRIDLSTFDTWAAESAGSTFGAMPAPMELTVTPDGKRAYVAADLAAAVVLLDTKTLEVLGFIAAGHKPDGIAYSPLGRLSSP